MPPDLIPESRIRFIDLRSDSLLLGLPGDLEAIVEMGESERAAELQAGRPIIYFDQNQWSTMAVALLELRGVPDEVVTAARWFEARVESEEILLPLSAGRLVETGALFGERREAVASVLLRLSRGWQMRNPQRVRRDEFARALGADVPDVPVFVPRMSDTFATESEGTEQAITWALALYESMLEPEQVEDPGDVGAVTKEGWAQKWVSIASALRADAADKAVVARVARANLVLDAADDLAVVARALGREPLEAADEVMRPGVIEDQPMLGLMLQVLTARLHNADQRPESGDLFDFVYLPCAAAYADVLVAERRMIGYLRGARQPPPRAALASNLADAVPLVESLLR